MARPHNKVLLGPEGGKKAQHWYDYTRSRAWIKRHEIHGHARTKAGVKYVLWLGFPEFRRKEQQ